MGIEIPRDRIAEDLVDALRACIKIDQQGNSTSGVVQISKFKRSNLERYVDSSLLPGRTDLINALMWEHLRGRVPDATLSGIDDVVAETIEELEQRGIVKLGGQVGDTRYPEDDWVTLTRKGVKALALGENPLVVASNDETVFNGRGFHAEVVQVCRGLFASGHYAQAVFEASKALNNEVKKKSGLACDGASLMTQAFSPVNPILKLNAISSQSEKDEQQGFMHLLQGAMLGIRNPSAHESVAFQDAAQALEYLAFFSLLFRKLDGATK